MIYCRNDESPVAVSHRLEIDGTGSRTVAQRYPYAGATNPCVTLHVFDRENRTSSQIWQSQNDENNCYLARVDAVRGGICLQTQDRLQQTLSLKRYHLAENRWQELYREHSATWINLTNDLQQLANGDLLFSSEDQGQRQALIIQSDGTIRRLAGPTHINQILSSNQQVATVTGWDTTPIENHLFELSLDGSGYRQLTQRAGIHDIVMHRDQSIFIDRYTDETLPIKSALKKAPRQLPKPFLKRSLTTSTLTRPMQNITSPRALKHQGRGPDATLPATPPANQRPASHHCVRLWRTRRAKSSSRVEFPAASAVCASRIRSAGAGQSRISQSR